MAFKIDKHRKWYFANKKKGSAGSFLSSDQRAEHLRLKAYAAKVSFPSSLFILPSGTAGIGPWGGR